MPLEFLHGHVAGFWIEPDNSANTDDRQDTPGGQIIDGAEGYVVPLRHLALRQETILSAALLVLLDEFAVHG